mmetsp:Transcript_37333/g.71564  ORF Transcript_37333/g.71564 Transcript_37333/m.71564 type:complete len:372 (+) Transcript_37333:69-1184(+)
MANPNTLPDIEATKLKISRTTRPLPKCPEEELGFGKVISDHMLKVRWTAVEGWGSPEILASGPIGLHPFSHVFHYAIECYEGMKAYTDDAGNTRLFRPEKNMERLNDSAKRLNLPGFNGEELLKCIKELLRVDKEWIPKQKGYSMYLRPVMFSTTPWLGLTQCSEAMLFVLCSPVGPYFKSGFVPIKLHVDDYYIRAWPGGTGNVKFGGNYAPTVASIKKAAEEGCSQSLYVYDADEWVTEAGTMNIFFLLKNSAGGKELWTPTLDDGCILPGITRLSVIELAKEWGECDVVEKRIPCREIVAALEEGRMLEIFGTGTAAVLQPVGALRYKGKELSCPPDGFGPGSFQVRMTAFLKGVQYGEQDHPWSIVI